MSTKTARPARLQNAEDLFQRGYGIGQVLQHKPGDGKIERGVGKRESHDRLLKDLAAAKVLFRDRRTRSVHELGINLDPDTLQAQRFGAACWACQRSESVTMLLAMRLVSRIRDAFRIDFQMKSIFETPTIERLAKVVESRVVEQVQQLSEQEAEQLCRQAA